MLECTSRYKNACQLCYDNYTACLSCMAIDFCTSLDLWATTLIHREITMDYCLDEMNTYAFCSVRAILLSYLLNFTCQSKRMPALMWHPMFYSLKEHLNNSLSQHVQIIFSLIPMTETLILLNTKKQLDLKRIIAIVQGSDAACSL
jgi:hypothetical protein